MYQEKHVDKENVISQNTATKTALTRSVVSLTTNIIAQMKPQKKNKLSKKRKQEILPEFEKIFSIGQDVCLDTTDDFQTDRRANRGKKAQNVDKETAGESGGDKTLAKQSETVTKCDDSSHLGCVSEDGLSDSTACLTKSTAVSKPTVSESGLSSENKLENVPFNTKHNVSTDTAQCPNCDQAVVKSEKSTHVVRCLRKKFSASEPSVDSDAELARTLQDEEDGKHQPQLNLVFCHMCQKDITHMNTVRRTQHVNKCIDASERSVVERDIAESLANETIVMDCPMCGKKLKTKASRVKHIKQCSSQMSLAPGDLLKLLRKQLEDASLKACIEPRERNSRHKNRFGQKKVKRGRRTIVEIPEVVYHSVMDKERLIAQRVSDEILLSRLPIDIKATPALIPSKLNDCDKSLTARPAIWRECHHTPSGHSPVKKYYVESLVPPLTPTRGSVTRSKSVAMIPGRTPEGSGDIMGTQTALILSDLEQHTVPQGWEPPSETDCSTSTETHQLVEDLSCMVNNKTLCDVVILTADQNLLHTHKFILFSRCPKLFHAIQAGDCASDFVDLSQFSKKSLLLFITYLYTAQVSLDLEYVLEVLDIAKEFGVTDLEKVCENFSVDQDLGNSQCVNSECLNGELIDNDDDEGNEVEGNKGFHDSDIEDVFEHVTLTQKIKSNNATDGSFEKAFYNDLYDDVKRFLESSQLSQSSQTVHNLSDEQVLNKVNQTALNPLSQSLVDHLNRSRIEICVGSGDYPESETELSEEQALQGGALDPDDTFVTMDTELDQVCSVVSASCLDVGSSGTVDGETVCTEVLGFSTPVGKSGSRDARVCSNMSQTPDLFGSPVANHSRIGPLGDGETAVEGCLSVMRKTSSMRLHSLCMAKTPEVKSSRTPNQSNMDDSATLPPSPTFGSAQPSRPAKPCMPESKKRKGCQSLRFSTSKRQCIVRENRNEACDLSTVYNMDGEIDLTQDSSSDEDQTNSPKHTSLTEMSSCFKNSSGILDPSVSSQGQIITVTDTDLRVCSPKCNKALNTTKDADCASGSDLCDPWEDFDEGGYNEDLPLCDSPTKIGKLASTESDNEVESGNSGYNPSSHQVDGQLQCELQGAPTNPESSLSQGSAYQQQMVDYDIIFAESFRDNMEGSSAVQEGVYKTPHTSLFGKVKKRTAPSPFTPMPKYDSMVTPELKHACKNIGVKPLPKKKMIMLLKDVYHQTHQYETDSEAEASFTVEGDAAVRVTCDNPPPLGRDVINSDPQQSSEKSPGSDSDDSAISGDDICSDEIVEKTFLVPAEDNLSVKASEAVAEKVYKFLKRNPDLYLKVLTYEPLEIGALHATLKTNGIRCGLQRLTDVLDKKCVNYTMKDAKQPASNRRTKKNRKPISSEI